MPTYEYECKSCGHSFDAIQSMNDDPLKVCTECGKEIRRVINGGSCVIFKGSGFYVNDKKGQSSSGKADKSVKTETSKTEAAPCSGCAAAETSSCPKAANS